VIYLKTLSVSQNMQTRWPDERKIMRWNGFGRKRSRPTRDKTLVFVCGVEVGGEKHNQKVRIAEA
jgi:hypothetical protein